MDSDNNNNNNNNNNKNPIKKIGRIIDDFANKQKNKKMDKQYKQIEPLNNPKILLRQLSYEARHPDPNYYIHIPKSNMNLRIIHCTIKGPEGTEYSGGYYHFAILLSQNHPFSPPKIMILNPNGRFYVGVELCISGITDMHPENYLASYKPGQICIALQSLLTDYSVNGVGFIDVPLKRHILKCASASSNFYCSYCGMYMHNVDFNRSAVKNLTNKASDQNLISNKTDQKTS